MTLLWLPAACRAADNEVVMFQVEAVGHPQIRNGKSQDETKWPATLKFLVNGNLYCTATIVGDKVVITAAHCVPKHSTFKVQLGQEFYHQEFSLDCTIDPRFNSWTYAFDTAMCLQTGQDPFPATLKRESIDLHLTKLYRDQTLFLLGYGCRVDGDKTTAGYLYGGNVTLLGVAQSPGGHVTATGKPILCPGDSGGAAYAGDPDNPAGKKRAIVGINSLYNASFYQSYITPLSTEARQFIEDWITVNGVSVCGFNTQAHCQGL
jgi:Trypsin